MERELARRRLEEAPVGRLGTIIATGQPHLVPCCFALVDDVVYTAVDAKPKARLELRRVSNVLAHPDACLLVDHYEDDWSALWWVRIDGTARIVSSEPEESAAREALTGKYPQYREVAIPGPVIAIEVKGWRSWP